MLRLTIDQMVELAWTWQGPTRREDEEDGAYYELRIAELPDFFLADKSYSALLPEIKPALRAFLASYLQRGETPPLPPLDRWLFTVGARATEVAQTGPEPKKLAVA